MEITKHKIRSVSERFDFLESVYDDVMKFAQAGSKNVRLVVNADLGIKLKDEDGIAGDIRQINFEVRLTNIDALDENMAVTLGSMLGSLLDENNLYNFEYSAEPL